MPEEGGAQAPVPADKDPQGVIKTRSNSFDDPLGFLKRMASQKDKRQSAVEIVKEEDEEPAAKAKDKAHDKTHDKAAHDKAAHDKPAKH